MIFSTIDIEIEMLIYLKFENVKSTDFITHLNN